MHEASDMGASSLLLLDVTVALVEDSSGPPGGEPRNEAETRIRKTPSEAMWSDRRSSVPRSFDASSPTDPTRSASDRGVHEHRSEAASVESVEPRHSCLLGKGVDQVFA
jgi:hypothetical protein